MPDHTHTHAPLDAFRMAAFRRVLQHHGRRFGTRWDIAPPQPVHSRAIARRTARYNFLNAVRAGLTTDPLLWPWSTFRDALGLVHDPWGGPATIRDVLGYTPGQMFWFTVDDRSCSDSARVPPAHTLASTGLVATFEAVVSACASSLRCRPDDRYRRGHPCRATFVGLATELGGSPRSSIAAAVGVSVRALHSLRARAEPSAIAVAKRCLVDPRLHAWCAPPGRQLPAFGS